MSHIFLNRTGFISNLSGSSEDLPYVRIDPSYETVGGVRAGVTIFDGTIQDALDKIFYPYQSPSFSWFSIAGQSTTLEVGASAATGSITFTWGTNNSSNVSANTIDIRDTTNSTYLITDTSNDGTEVYDNGVGTTTNTNSFHRWTIYGEDIDGNNFNRTFNINWYWRFYWGSSTATTGTEAMIEGLQSNSLYNSRPRTYSCAANNYKWIVYPTSFGLANGFKDDDTGFAVPMESPETVSVTNDYGITTDYYAYRSTNSIVSSVSIIVS